jgi:hypothetical protein
MATPDQAVSILNKLADELHKRQTDVGTFNDAYLGEQKLTFASDDFRDYFGSRYAKFSDNWCGIVADAPHERLEVTGIRLDGAEDGDKELWESWRQNDADALSDLAFLDAIIGKRSFAHVWGNSDDEPVINWGHPSQMIVGYDPATRQRISGAHIWRDEMTEYAALDYDGELWKFERPLAAGPALEAAGFILPAGAASSEGWKPRQPSSDDTWPLPNPMGKNSFVEIPNRPRLVGEPTSDIAGTLAMQHAINLFWAQLFAASDEATLGQRVIIGAEMPTVPVLDGDGNQVGERPIDIKKMARDRALWLEDPATKIEQWQAAKLDVFTDVIEIMVGHIAAQTRTPSHYLMIGGSIANVSGDAMKALETGLVMRTKEKTQHFGRAVRDVFELVALAQDDTAKAKAVRGGEVLWKDVENRSDAQRADSLQKKHAMGYPLRYILELDGLPPTEVTRIMSMVDEEGLGAVVSRLTRSTEAPSPLTAPTDADFGA